jgi:hypothetical protein
MSSAGDLDPNLVTRSTVPFGTALTMHPPLSIPISAIQFPIGQLRQRGKGVVRRRSSRSAKNTGMQPKFDH